MSSTTEEKLWVVCPVCHKANPADARFCQHCWGASIPVGSPLTTEELAEAARHRQDYLKRRKRIRIAVIAGAVLAFAYVVFLSLANFTDLIFKPLQTLNSASLSGEWAMFRHDLERSGSTGTGGIIPQGKLKWAFQAGAQIHSSPAIAGGSVFFGSQDYKFYALDLETGAKRWQYETGSFVDSSPAVAKGIVYFGSNDGNLYALNAGSGQKVWSFKTPFPVRSAPAVAGTNLYFGSDDYYLYVLDASNGNRLWDYDTGSPAVSAPVVSNGILYIGTAGGASYGFNALNGQRRLRFNSHYAVYAAPAVVDGTVYFITTNGVLYVVDGKVRTWLWEHEIKPLWVQMYVMGIPGIPKPPSQSGFLWSLSLRGGANSSPVVSGDTLYVGLDNKLVAVDLKNRKRLWSFATKGSVRSSPAVADNIVYVGSDDGKLYAVDAASGTKLWDFSTGGAITSSPAIANGVIYFGSQDGNFYAIK